MLSAICVGVSRSSIFGKAETEGHPDVKAIDVNQKVAGMGQERGATPLIYSCVADELQGTLRGLIWLLTCDVVCTKKPAAACCCSCACTIPAPS